MGVISSAFVVVRPRPGSIAGTYSTRDRFNLQLALLPPLDRLGEGAGRVGNRDAAVRVERAEPHPRLFPFRGHVEDQSTRPCLVDGGPLLAMVLHDDRHVHPPGSAWDLTSSGAYSS